MLEVPPKLDRADGDVHPSGNPHIQTSPENIARVAGPLSDRLAELDPADKAHPARRHAKNGSAACRERVWQDGQISEHAVATQHKSTGYALRRPNASITRQ